MCSALHHEKLLTDFVFGRMSWEPRDSNLFRIGMRSPPMPVAVMRLHELPDLPVG